jgi:Ca2+-binding RTX toxin-like protein
MTAGVNFLASGMNFASGVATVVNGTNGIDIIKLGLGTSTGNTVNGGDGVDQIRGSNGVDTINGQAGNDKIMSLGGADILTGGSGADQFRYFSASDSGLGANADRITDFLSGTDRLNFLLIDPDPFTAGDQSFVFVDTVAFTNNGVAQIRWADLGADLRVEADLNGDGVADMHIVLEGAGAQVLTAGDFIL